VSLHPLGSAEHKTTSFPLIQAGSDYNVSVLFLFLYVRSGRCDTLRPDACTLLWLAGTLYAQCTYGIFGREISKHAVIYGAYIWFWPTMHISH